MPQDEDSDFLELRSEAEIDFEGWLTREIPKGTIISNPEWWAPRILRVAKWVLRAKGDMPAAPAAGDTLDTDMYWNDADTEGFAGTTLDNAVRYVADDIPTSEMPVTLTFQCAKALPNVQVLVTGVDGEGDLQYEIIDTAIAAQQSNLRDK